MLTRERYKQRLWIDQASGDFGHHDSLPIDPWVLGAMLGSGNLDQTQEAVAPFAESLRVVEWAGAGGALAVEEAPAEARLASGRSNALVTALRELALWGIQGHETHIPRIYRNAHRAARLALLQGMLDADGWIEDAGGIRFCTTSYRLARNAIE